MRLINAKTLGIQEFPSEDAYPPYAILSHTWGPPEQECTLQSMTQPDVSSRAGYSKIKLCCDQALKDGLSWAWVDTCCIDKTSTAELSEAINSMFRWYKKASICYAYIQDVDTIDGLERSRWFTRGWTLQELVAPQNVVFFSKSWSILGRKLELKEVLWKITGIEPAVLEFGTLSNVTVAKKMSWAAKRKTTRVEDLAYCLLGIFDVNMPMLYGEGRKSFIRLQEEIMKSSYDSTLFAWSQCPPTRKAEDFIKGEATSSASESERLCGLLAENPTLFSHSKDIVPLEDNFQSGDDVKSGSGRIVIRLPRFRKGSQFFAALPCIAGSSYLAFPLDTWHSEFVARRPEIFLVHADDLYTPSLSMRRFQVKPPTQEPIHAQPPPPNVSYIAMIEFRDLISHRHPFVKDCRCVGDVHCSPHAIYDKSASKLTFTRGNTGLHCACLLQIRIEWGSKLKEAAVLIGGDPTRDGKLWVAIVPILPETDTDKAFHRIWTRDPALASHCTTRSMLIDKVASGSNESAFARAGGTQVKEWSMGACEPVWITHRSLFTTPVGAYVDMAIDDMWYTGFIFASAKIELLHVYPAEKAFEITISLEYRRNK